MRDPLKEAISDLAAEARNRPFDNTVTAEQAMAHVCEETATKWVAAQWKRQSAHFLLIEMIEKHIDEDTARDLFASLLNAMKTTTGWGAHAQVGRELEHALRLHMAEDLAYAAQEDVDNYDPTDEEMNRPISASDVSDPFLAERRSFTRDHNASLRASRVIR